MTTAQHCPHLSALTDLAAWSDAFPMEAPATHEAALADLEDFEPFGSETFPGAVSIVVAVLEAHRTHRLHTLPPGPRDEPERVTVELRQWEETPTDPEAGYVLSICPHGPDAGRTSELRATYAAHEATTDRQSRGVAGAAAIAAALAPQIAELVAQSDLLGHLLKDDDSLEWIDEYSVDLRVVTASGVQDAAWAGPFTTWDEAHAFAAHTALGRSAAQVRAASPLELVSLCGTLTMDDLIVEARVGAYGTGGELLEVAYLPAEATETDKGAEGFYIELGVDMEGRRDQIGEAGPFATPFMAEFFARSFIGSTSRQITARAALTGLRAEYVECPRSMGEAADLPIRGATICQVTDAEGTVIAYDLPESAKN